MMTTINIVIIIVFLLCLLLSFGFPQQHFAQFPALQRRATFSSHVYSRPVITTGHSSSVLTLPALLALPA